MTRTPVESSAISSMGYDAATQTLEVQYRGKNDAPGPVWQAAPVSQRDFDCLCAPGASIGRLVAVLKANASVTWTRVAEEVPSA
jgi:hypothetical protein